MFEKPTWRDVVLFERRDHGDESEYVFIKDRIRLLKESNYEHKLLNDMYWPLASPDANALCAVAYERADGAGRFENSSYAVVAYEEEPGRSPVVFVGDEIAEQIQLW